MGINVPNHLNRHHDYKIQDCIEKSQNSIESPIKFGKVKAKNIFKMFFKANQISLCIGQET